MFGELPKLFDRNFVIGYFLPVAVFITVSGLIVAPYPFGIRLLDFLTNDVLTGTTLIGLLSWVGGVVLLALNRDLYRWLEGYRRFNPLKLFGWMEKRRYKNIVNELETLDDKYRECIRVKTEFPTKFRMRRNRLMEQLAEEFPDKEELLLPTPFGNVLRAFEIYPRVMYGFEAIDGWERLLTVISKDYLALVDAAKAQVDFWVNLGAVFILLQIEYITVTSISGTPIQWWVVVLFVILGAVAPLRATSSAREWGEFVKAAFDIYRFKLLESFGVELPEDREAEKVLWKRYSQAIIYRLPDSLPELRNSTKKPAKKKIR